MGDDELLLRSGTLRCAVSPFGASLRRLWMEEPGKPPRDLVWGYANKEAKRGGQGDVLMPFPGRIASGAYTFQGQRHELAKNDKEGPNAIHGFLRSVTWELGPNHAATAQFRTRLAAGDHPGYPFDLDIVVGYELLPTGLACAFVARNAGSTPAPFGAGFHPYVVGEAAVDSTLLRSPASQVIQSDGLLPTGKTLGVPGELDFRKPRAVGDLRLNHCFGGLGRDGDGFARVNVGDIEVWMDRTFQYVVLYTGDALGPDARRALGVEPMSCATDAFNHPSWGLKVLQPGETFAGTWGIAI